MTKANVGNANSLSFNSLFPCWKKSSRQQEMLCQELFRREFSNLFL